MWQVNDGSGDMAVHNTSIYEYEPILNKAYDITGPLNYDFDEWKIELRIENDVLPGTDLIPPAVYQIIAISDTLVKVTFTENVDLITAETSGNYTINNNIVITDVRRHSIQFSVVYLDVSSMATNQYTLSISNVEDLAGNPIVSVDSDFEHQSSAGINDLFRNAEISIYPNPASDKFTLNISSLENLNKELSLTINSLAGKTILSKQYKLQAGINNFEINTSTLAKGLYFIKIGSGGSSGVEKLLIK
jgi:hypothetical protein